MPFQNFSMWRGKLPHWRADDVRYYVTFRHRRELTPLECNLLLNALARPDGKKWDLHIACVLPTGTELMFTMRPGGDGTPHELSDIVEKAKTTCGKKIIKITGERWPPFFEESYDRIVRDDAEFEERWMAIVESPVNAGLVEEPDDYPALWVPAQPTTFSPPPAGPSSRPGTIRPETGF